MTSKIYTRTGDKGQTTLADGTSTPKTSPRVEAYGTLDETNAQVGVVRALTDDHLLGNEGDKWSGITANLKGSVKEAGWASAHF